MNGNMVYSFIHSFIHNMIGAIGIGAPSIK